MLFMIKAKYKEEEKNIYIKIFFFVSISPFAEVNNIMVQSISSNVRKYVVCLPPRCNFLWEGDGDF